MDQTSVGKGAKALLHGRPRSDAEAQGATCRICMEAEPVGSLVSPCRCRGTMKYVHRECLQKWRATSSNQRSYYRCDQCQCRYGGACGAVAELLGSSGIGISCPSLAFAASACLSASLCLWLVSLAVRFTSLQVLGGGTMLVVMAVCILVSSFEIGIGSVSVYGLNFT